jgi:hypothetical protein
MPGNPTVVRHMRAIGQLVAAQGVRVVEVSGWTTRGRSSDLNPRQVLCHHTGVPVDTTSTLINGRADLPGPLCNFELRRGGTVGLLASGRANHAGTGTVLNSETYGIEATGPIPAGCDGVPCFPQYPQYIVLAWAIAKHHGWLVSRIYGHKETARPDGRKIDPAFGDRYPTPYLDMNRFRAAVAAYSGEDEIDMATGDQIMARINQLSADLTVHGTTSLGGEGSSTTETYASYHRANRAGLKLLALSQIEILDHLGLPVSDELRRYATT